MPPVAVVTDTTAYLTPALVDEHDLHVVSLYVHRGDRQDRESELGSWDAFYDELRRAAELPTTSQPSIGDFLEVYEPLLEQGRDIVSIHLSGGISGTVESARQAAAQSSAPERVRVFDSSTACGGLGAIAMAGAAAARAGRSHDEVAARVEEATAAVRIWFAIDTLEYLRRGGRIGRAQAWMGSALKIKPILSVESEITPVERVRTAGRAFERMVEYMHEMQASGIDGWIVQHIQDPDRAQQLVERGREIFGTGPVFVSEVGAVIGTHVGPGLLGVGGLPRALLS